MRHQLKIIFELGKMRISLPVALSALTGYVLFAGNVDRQGWLLVVGVFLMSCSASVLNQWQERATDAQMPRTKNRPIPSGRISANFALFIAFIFALSGSLVLIFSNPLVVLVLSWATLLFYNEVYTPLKKITAFAVVPGSVVGALPPIIGWAGAGGGLTSNVILLVAIFFFIGQIPHFWLLVMLYGEQYKTAKLPCLNQVLSIAQIKRVTYVWVLSTIASALLVVLFVIENKLAVFLLLLYVFYLLLSLTKTVFSQNTFNVRPSFYKLNLLYLLMMILLIVDSLLGT